jgi:hypothetical protein
VHLEARDRPVTVSARSRPWRHPRSNGTSREDLVGDATRVTAVLVLIEAVVSTDMNPTGPATGEPA